MLINCVNYVDGVKKRDMALEDLRDFVEHPEGFVWVALRDPGHEELDEIRRAFHLHNLPFEDAHKGHQRPKLEEYEDMIFVTMTLVEKSGRELQTGDVMVFVGTDFVVSIRRRSTQNFLGVRARCEREPELLKLGPSYVLYALLDAVVDRYFPLLDMLDSELESIEERIFEPDSARQNVERLYALKRTGGVLKHATAPLLEVVGNLYGNRTPAACSNTRDYFRDVADHLARINTAIEQMRETAVTAIAVNLSMATIESGEVTKRLAAWAAIFAVATAFAGLWGMNFEFMPELHWRWGYPAALGVIAATCGLVAWRFRRAGWL